MIDTTQYPVQVRANARLVDAGRKKVEQCPVAQQTEICVVLIACLLYTSDAADE